LLPEYSILAKGYTWRLIPPATTIISIFVSTLIGTVTQGSDIWLVDNGASKNMTGFRSSLTKLIEKSSSLQVELGDDSRHGVKAVGEASYHLDSSNSISIKMFCLYKA
jgi:hypothetical protein